MKSSRKKSDSIASRTRLRLSNATNTSKKRRVRVIESDDSDSGELPSPEKTLDVEEIERLHKEDAYEAIKRFEERQKENSSVGESSSDAGVVTNPENMESDELSIDFRSSRENEHSGPKAGSKRRASHNPYTLRDVYPVRRRSQIPMLNFDSPEAEGDHQESGDDADTEEDEEQNGGEEEQAEIAGQAQEEGGEDEQEKVGEDEREEGDEDEQEKVAEDEREEEGEDEQEEEEEAIGVEAVEEDLLDLEEVVEEHEEVAGQGQEEVVEEEQVGAEDNVMISGDEEEQGGQDREQVVEENLDSGENQVVRVNRNTFTNQQSSRVHQTTFTNQGRVHQSPVFTRPASVNRSTNIKQHAEANQSNATINQLPKRRSTGMNLPVITSTPFTHRVPVVADTNNNGQEMNISPLVPNESMRESLNRKLIFTEKANKRKQMPPPSQRERSRTGRRVSTFDLARGENKTVSKKKEEQSSVTSAERYVGNDVFGNYHILKDDQVKEILNKAVPNHDVREEEMSNYTLRINHVLEDLLGHLCETTDQPYGVFTFQQLRKVLIDNKILPEGYPGEELIRLMKQLMTRKDFVRSEGVLFPSKSDKSLDTAKYLFK